MAGKRILSSSMVFTALKSYHFTKLRLDLADAQLFYSAPKMYMRLEIWKRKNVTSNDDIVNKGKDSLRCVGCKMASFLKFKDPDTFPSTIADWLKVFLAAFVIQQQLVQQTDAKALLISLKAL